MIVEAVTPRNIVTDRSADAAIERLRSQLIEESRPHDTSVRDWVTKVCPERSEKAEGVVNEDEFAMFTKFFGTSRGVVCWTLCTCFGFQAIFDTFVPELTTAVILVRSEKVISHGDGYRCHYNEHDEVARAAAVDRTRTMPVNELPAFDMPVEPSTDQRPPDDQEDQAIEVEDQVEYPEGDPEVDPEEDADANPDGPQQATRDGTPEANPAEDPEENPEEEPPQSGDDDGDDDADPENPSD
jgi:hypothetical protein